MSYHKEEEQWNCEYCQQLCVMVRGKSIDMHTKKKHVCKELIKKIKEGLIKPKRRSLSDFFTRSRFEVQFVCGWCSAKWIFSDQAEHKLYVCPNCEAEGSKFEHPKYGDIALTRWANALGKPIPYHLRKYLK
jgi:DNA-directed RNA polymerase subunit RPC12/RpoP